MLAFGQKQEKLVWTITMMYQDSRDLPHLAKNDIPRKALVEAYEKALSLGLKSM